MSSAGGEGGGGEGGATTTTATTKKRRTSYRLMDADEIDAAVPFASEEEAAAMQQRGGGCGGGEKRLCKRAQMPSSNNPVAVFEIPKAPRKQRQHQQQQPCCLKQQQEQKDVEGERCRRVRMAKDDFIVSKGRVTKAVFMGLLHSSSEEHRARCFREVVSVSADQPFADGTVFVIHDISTVCRALMQSYAFFHRRPEQMWEQESAILDFLERNLAATSSFFPLGSAAVVQGKVCQPWLTLKASILRAGVCPLALAVKNAAAASAAEGHSNSSNKKRAGEWYCEREWFMANFIVRKSLLKRGGEERSASEVYYDDEDDDEPMVMASYRDWAAVVAGGGREEAFRGKIPCTSRLAHDARIACGRTDPLGMWDRGSAEVSRAADMVDELGKLRSVEGLGNLRAALIARSRQKVVKYCSTPFDASVTEPVQRVLDALVVTGPPARDSHPDGI